MAAQAYLDQVQNAYIAYYGRPADPEGQLYWANKLEAVGGNLTALVNEFGNSAEFNAFAAGKSNSTLIDQLYINLFNRSADVSGLNWYVGELLAGRKTLATIALDVLNGATGVDTTTLASKFQASNAFTAAIDTPSERDSYNANTINSVKDWLKGISTSTASAAAVASINTNLPIILQAGAASNPMEFILTTGSDINKQANIFTASPDFTPAGNYRENTLQDEDVLIGVNTNQALPATLNATLSNNSGVAAAAGSNTISPKMTDIRIMNIAFTGSGAAAVNQLDLQDSSGYTDVNITRINDGVSINDGDGFMEAGERAASIDSMRFIPVNLSVASTGQDRPHVEFTFTDAGAAAANDATKISLKNANIGRLAIEENAADGTLNQGIETITLDSSVSANSAQTLAAQDLVTLLITGSQNLSLGGRANVTGAQGNEAIHYDAGLDHVAGSLNIVNASVFSGALDYAIGREINAGQNGTSGVNVDLQVMGGSNNDTFRLVANSSVDAKDVISGGAGTNTLVMFGGNSQITADVSATNTVTPNIKGVQALEIRTGHDTAVAADNVNINANAFDSLASIYVRNEGEQQLILGGTWTSASEIMTVNLNNLTSAQANAITLVHGTTGNSSMGNNLLNIGLSDSTGVADTATVALVDGTNADTVFSADIDVLGVENMTIVDRDSESNNLFITQAIATLGGATPAGANVAYQSGSKLTLQGGLAGTYTNLDTIASTQNANVLNGYGYSSINTSEANSTTILSGNSTTVNAATRDTAVPLNRDVAIFKDNIGNINTNRLLVETFDAATNLSDVVARFGEITRTNGVSSQAITTGSGNDSLIFDALNTTNSGFSSGDTVKAGTGSDTLIIDGQNTTRISLQKSEWDNTTGIDTLRLAGNSGITTPQVGNGQTVKNNAGSYYIEIDNEFVKQTDAGNGLVIINNDGNLSTNTETDLVLNLRGLNQTSNVNFIGANGNSAAAIASNRIMIDDNSANGANKLDGGDTNTDVLTNTGNNNVLEVFNTAQLSINDFANTKNFGRVEFTNDLSVAQTLTMSLNNTVMDQLVDSTHVAANTPTQNVATGITTTNVERLVVVAQNNANTANAVANLNIDAGMVGNAFALDIIVDRGTSNTIIGTAGADKIVLMGNYTATEQTADRHSEVTLFADVAGSTVILHPNTASALTSTALTTALPANGVAYKGANGILGDADDNLLAYTGNIYTLNTGDTLETFGGVDLRAIGLDGDSNATVSVSGLNLIAHSAVRITEAQLAAFSSIKFVGNEAHVLIIDNTSTTLNLSNITFVDTGVNSALKVLTTTALTTTTLSGSVGSIPVSYATTAGTTSNPTNTGSVVLTADKTSVNEGSTVSFSIEGATAGSKYNLAVYGTGTFNTADYTAPTTPVTIGTDGKASFSILTAADSSTEGAETMVVTATLEGSTSGISQSVTVNDTSNALGTPTLTPAAQTMTESGTPVTFTVTNMAPGSYPITVTGITSGYMLSAPVLVIGAGETSGFFTISASADNLTEGTQTMVVSVAGVTQSITINDTSMATGTTTIAAQGGITSVNEGSAVTYNLTNIAPGTYSVAVSGTNIIATDYSTPSTVVIPTNSTSGTITVMASADLTTEGPEGMIVTVNGVSSAPVTINDTSVSAVIATLTTTAANVNEGDSLLYTLNNVVAGTTYTLSGTGTATSGTDYTFANATTDAPIISVMVPTGETSVTFKLKASTDAITDIAETVIVSATPTGGAAITSTAVTINDKTPTLSTTTTTAVNEGATVTYTLANVAAGTYNISATGSGVTAADYAVTPVSPITVDATGTATFTVTLANDLTTEVATESMTVTATLSGTGTIYSANAITVNDTSLTPTNSAVSVSAAGSDNASAANKTYTVAAGSTYTYTIDGFGSGDKLVFPAGNTPSVEQVTWDDSFVDLTYAVSGITVTIHLTGLTAAQDGNLNSLTDFNSFFGAGTIA